MLIGTEESTTSVLSCNISGNSSTFEEYTLFCFKSWEFSGQNLGLVFFSFLFFSFENNFIILNFSKVSSDGSNVGEEVSFIVVVEFL